MTFVRFHANKGNVFVNKYVSWIFTALLFLAKFLFDKIDHSYGRGVHHNF